MKFLLEQKKIIEYHPADLRNIVLLKDGVHGGDGHEEMTNRKYL